MKNVLLLSIITLTKDDSQGLARALASAALWRGRGVEQIVVDGGTGSGPLLAPGIVYLRHPAKGVADAMNRGLQIAKGDWVWFVHGGDAVHETLDPDWMLWYLASTRADVVAGALHFDGEAAPRAQPGLRDQWPLAACWLMHPATLVRAERLRAAGGFRTRWRVAMDFDLWHRLVGPCMPVDVLSVPFARFARGGLSEAAETRPLALKEDAAVIRTYGTEMWRQVFRLNAKWAWRWLRVWTSR